MVQTYVLCAPTAEEGFFRSAELLDLPRRRKQIVEARQILQVLQKARTIELYYYGVVDPIFYSTRTEKFIREVENYDRLWSAYRRSGKRLVIQESSIFEVTTEEFKKYRTVPSGAQYRITIEDQREIVEWYDAGYHRVPRDYVAIADEGEELFGVGFVSHTAPRMWVGYEFALMRYIADHEAALPGGRQLGPTDVDFPWWVNSTAVIATHQSSVLRKEFVRGEVRRFWDFAETHPAFIGHHPEWISSGYVWPVFSDAKSSVCRVTRQDIINFELGIDFGPRHSSPITTDDKPSRGKDEKTSFEQLNTKGIVPLRSDGTPFY